MKFFEEFKKFALRGNVVDLAVGIIIGTAFGKIVSSLVSDVIMPPIGLILGGVDFSNFAIVLKSAEGENPPVLLSYGKFLNNVVDFLIIAFSVFLLIKGINSLKSKEQEKPKISEPSIEVKLLTEIRDLLKK
ncbi:MAG: large-conductance mechanosensitive channel protein MscL [Ignavibacterium sp.]|nr:large-conductance mechanosensitive channel protein MscL [Ignavibacterium sp.]MCX7611269.1 large-conductance mechanosensitive channel protein MscL [Ignavibacterium sp.]MDW8374864.1 large-conductance mechanosensitive channel protein MscL [Ignavibacteriales bacterium]